MNQKAYDPNQWKIIELKRSEIQPHPKNPRMITKEAFANLKKHIQDFGLTDGAIAISTREDKPYRVVSGHQRLKALDEILGYPKKIDDYTLKTTSRLFASAVEELKFIIAMNARNVQGHDDNDMLFEALYEIKDDGEELKHIGYDDLELSLTFMGREEELIGEGLLPDDDEVKEAKGTLNEIKEARAKGKKSFEMGNNTDFFVSIVGKSREQILEVRRLLGILDGDRVITADRALSIIKKR